MIYIAVSNEFLGALDIVSRPMKGTKVETVTKILLEQRKKVKDVTLVLAEILG